MYVCKAYLWNKESLMVYNLERKQKELNRLRPRSHGTGSVWSRHLVRSVYGHIYSYHFFYDTLKLSSVILSQI